tara:strand:+ start:798 stop:1547 length:750 start_codon:yes stop_codon:yes gene_type:complete
MELNYEKTYHEVERDHWWFKTRRNILLKMINGLDKEARILDIGSSSGLMLQELKDLGFNPHNLYGVDISEKAIANCKSNGFDNAYVMDAHNITLSEGSFDLVIASDCLEHLERDEEALANWHTLLKPNGQIIIFVPAYQFLWSRHDDVNFHFRRYTNGELRMKMENNNFKIQKSGYWNFLLFIPIAGVRLLGNLFGGKKQNGSEEMDGDLAMPGKLSNTVLMSVVNLENTMIPSLRFPFGVSTFCIATK